MRLNRLLTIFFLTLASSLSLSAQSKSEKVDSLVSLLSAQSMSITEKYGMTFREIVGPARFLHNNTYLICDTATWNVNFNQIYARGHVKILQEQTVLTSDNLTYLIDQDLAQFRGVLVQLEDKDHNTLRTRYLDYNTKDSVAVFQNGGAMKDKDGQIIESSTGTYDSKAKTFTFTDNVNMFTDSIFVKTKTLAYQTDIAKATFGASTNAWKDDKMLSADAGWYDRNEELFFFTDKVHGLSQDKEAWSDSLYFNRTTMNVDMLGNVELVDTVKNARTLAGKIEYTDSTSWLKMTRDPVIVGVTESEGKKDTVWFAADTLIYHSVPKCDLPDGVESAAASRLQNLNTDAVGEYRRKAAEAAAQAAAEKAKNNPDAMAQDRGPDGAPVSEKKDLENQEETQKGDNPPKTESGAEKRDSKEKDLPPQTPDTTLKQPSDTLKQTADTLDIASDTLNFASDSLKSSSDTLKAAADSLKPVLDSTKVGFMTAINNIRMFRSDIQVVCDSLEYTDLDSLVRLYRKPIVWSETNRQFSSDTLFALIHNKTMEKAQLLTNAFIIVEEAEKCFDQIRSSEMIAYFDSTAALSRFDALGDANAVFYLKEDSTFATVNKSQAKMLHATFLNGDIDKVYYFDGVKNDAYPLAQMTDDERVLKGFLWQPERRPMSRFDISDCELRQSERSKYEARPHAEFKETDIYFPGYIASVNKKIKESKIAKARARQMQAQTDSLNTDSLAVADSLKPISDSLAANTDSLAVTDSLSTDKKPVVNVPDSVPEKIDSAVAEPLDPQAIKAAEKAAAKKAAEEARQKKLAEKEAKWARLDSLDAAKAQRKIDKANEKLRAKKRKALESEYEQIRKDNDRRGKYQAMYEKKKARMAERANRKPAPEVSADESEKPEKTKKASKEHSEAVQSSKEE